MFKSAVFFMVFLFASVVHCQLYWEKTNGPTGGFMRSVVKGPENKVICGSRDGRIFYSEDNGVNWQRADTIFGINIVDFVYCDDGSMLAATVGSMGVHRSFDGGKTWPFSRLGNEQVWALEKDPLGHIYAGTRTNSHIWKSTDNGYNWLLSHQLSEQNNINDLGYNSITSTMFSANNNGFYRSLDFGETWEPLTNGIGVAKSINCITVDVNGNLYGGSQEEGGAVYLSTNNGDSWTNMDTSQTFGDIINIGIDDILAVEDFLLVATHAGVARSTDMGQSWEFITNGLRATNILDFAYDRITNTIYAANQRGGIFISNDYGTSWQLKSNGINASLTYQITFNQNGFMYTASYYNGLHRSINLGKDWKIIVNGITDYRHESICATSDNLLLSGTREGYFSSTNNGDEWQRGNGLETNTVFRIEEDLAGNWYFGLWGTSFMRSTDKGSSWTTAIPEFVFSIAVDSTGNIFAGTNSGRIYKSTDNGESWQDVSYGGLEQRAVYSIGVRNDREIFAAIYDGTGIFYTQEGGGNWLQVNQGMYDIIVWDMEVDKAGYVYAATNESVWRTKTNTVITDVDNELEDFQPGKYYLSQNYPNPFNPTTKIRFTIPTLPDGQAGPPASSPLAKGRIEEGFVKLKVYDILR